MHYNLVQDVFGHSVVVNFLYDNKKKCDATCQKQLFTALKSTCSFAKKAC